MLSYIEKKFQEWLTNIKENYNYILNSSEVAARNAFEAGNNTPKEQSIGFPEAFINLSLQECLEKYPDEILKHCAKKGKRPIKWTAFKKSGKYAYSGIALVPLEQFYFSNQDFLNDIDENQDEVIKGTIKNNNYHIYINDSFNTKEIYDNNEYPFLTRLILIKCNI